MNETNTDSEWAIIQVIMGIPSTMFAQLWALTWCALLAWSRLHKRRTIGVDIEKTLHHKYRTIGTSRRMFTYGDLSALLRIQYGSHLCTLYAADTWKQTADQIVVPCWRHMQSSHSQKYFTTQKSRKDFIRSAMRPTVFVTEPTLLWALPETTLPIMWAVYRGTTRAIPGEPHVLCPVDRGIRTALDSDSACSSGNYFHFAD